MPSLETAPHERPEHKYSMAFVGYGINPEQAEIELAYNHEVDHEIGTRTATSPWACPTLRRLRQCPQGRWQRVPGARPPKGGTTIIAFVTDPDGYKIKLISTESTT